MAEKLTPQEIEYLQINAITNYLQTADQVRHALTPTANKDTVERVKQAVNTTLRRSVFKPTATYEDLVGPGVEVGVAMGLSEIEAAVFLYGLVAGTMGEIFDDGDRIVGAVGGLTTEFREETADMKNDMWKNVNTSLGRLVDMATKQHPKIPRKKIETYFGTIKEVGRDMGKYMHKKTEADVFPIRNELVKGAEKIGRVRPGVMPHLH